MKRGLGTLFILLVCLVSCTAAVGQTSPIRGVVWQQPEGIQEAISDLYEMRRAGVQAVRTGVIEDGQLLTVTDGLGIQVFQEIPIEYLPATELEDTLAFATHMLDQALAHAATHPSARHFGLARMSDTSDPAACTYFEQLSQRVRERGPTDAQTYYVTPFVKTDACAGAVDLVLLGTLNSDNPRLLLEEYVAQDSVLAGRTGIGALGTWVDDDVEPGLRTPHSRQWQARYLENNLNRLLSRRAPVQPYAVFVYRWNDLADSEGGTPGREHPIPVTYGLLDGHEKRLAFEVVEGIYTGNQMVFAFDQGEEATSSWPWITLLGWGGIAILGIFYAASPRLRFMVPRYFGARGFYRDAVREGRDVLLGSSVALLSVTALTTGVLWSAAINVYAIDEAFLMLLRWAADPIQGMLLSTQSYPWAAVVIVALVFAASALLWSLVLALASRQRFALAPSQALMLVVWPRWPILLLLPAAMVVPTLEDEPARTIVLVLVVIWAGLMLFTVARTAYDFHAVTRTPLYVALAALLVNPYVVLLLVLVLVVLLNMPETTFLYHLLTRT